MLELGSADCLQPWHQYASIYWNTCLCIKRRLRDHTNNILSSILCDEREYFDETVCFAENMQGILCITGHTYWQYGCMQKTHYLVAVSVPSVECQARHIYIYCKWINQRNYARFYLNYTKWRLSIYLKSYVMPHAVLNQLFHSFVIRLWYKAFDWHKIQF